jgi:hypothetical protein
MKKIAFLLAFLALAFTGLAVASAQTPQAFEYISPLPGARLVRAGTTITLRQGDFMDPKSLTTNLFQVSGNLSGAHDGQTLLADDRKTVIFKPDRAFTPGETVRVRLAPGLRTAAGELLGGQEFQFFISPKALEDRLDLPSQPLASELGVSPSQVDLATGGVGAAPSASLASEYATLPESFPPITVTHPATGTGEGDLFLSNFRIYPSFAVSNPYLLILDNQGEPVFYRQMPPGVVVTDFKKQPNGLLTYWDAFLPGYRALDDTYTLTDTFTAGNGYKFDLHDIQILPNGHALSLIYDPEPVDMSQIVVGGVPTATVLGLVVQELDVDKNVVFQWRSWDHFQITDSYEDLTLPTVDYVHGNAVELDSDGNLLISSRHMSEVTKINRQTGDIIWRLGGKNNQFQFLNDTQMFAYQHDIRRLPNGHITLFDNHDRFAPEYSRAVEYALDEVNKTATLVWQYRNTPDSKAAAMGSAQRLPNGNTVIGWGIGSPALTEVHPDGSKAFELAFQPYESSYRAFRFPWQGQPGWPPLALALRQGKDTTLAFSWNGATDVSAYRLYAGMSADDVNTFLGTPPKTSFETRVDITSLVNDYCYFRVAALNGKGAEVSFSKPAFAFNSACAQNFYLPLVNLNR